MLDDDLNTCGSFIDEHSLLIAYQTDDMRCQLCRYDSDKWNDNNH